MTNPLSGRLDRVLDALPCSYPGPGGAVAVLRDGEVLLLVDRSYMPHVLAWTRETLLDFPDP